MVSRALALVVTGLLNLAGPLQTQEFPLPSTTSLGETEVGHCGPTPDASVRRRPDGRCETAWRFPVQEWKFQHGPYTLFIDVRSDFPVNLELHRLEEYIQDGASMGFRKVGTNLLDVPADRSTMRTAKVVLTRPGNYLLTVISAEPIGEGRYRVGLDRAAIAPPEAERPQPNIKALEPKPSVRADQYFRGLALLPAQARFGERVTLTPTFTDIPASCDWRATSTAVEGLLPPGLKLRPDSTIVEGTPRQLGTWNFTYSLRRIHCLGTPTIYGDRSASVTFTVVP